MGSLLSPGIQTNEVDLTSYIPAVPSSIGAVVGYSVWGPAMQPTPVVNEGQLVSLFGAPNNNTYPWFFTAANFLAYSSSLLFERVVGTNAHNAVQTPTGGVSTAPVITQAGSGYTTVPAVTFSAPQVAGGITATGTAVLTGTTVTGITITNNGTGYTTAPTILIAPPTTGIQAAATCTISLTGAKVLNSTNFAWQFEGVNSNMFGQVIAKYIGAYGNNIGISYADSATYASWSFAGSFGVAPSTSAYAASIGGSNDEIHVVVYDATGVITGTAGTVLKAYPFLSKAKDATDSYGNSIYYINNINANDNYVYFIGTPMTTNPDWGSNAAGTAFTSLATAVTFVLTNGTDDYTGEDGILESGWDVLKNKDLYTVNLTMGANADATLASYIINNAYTRQDCVAFVSPVNTLTGAIISDNDETAAADISTWRTALPSGIVGTYGVSDTGYKRQLDRYNNVYRWIPLNGDIAGLAARTDRTNNPWWSPAGYNRGIIQNVSALAYNPSLSDRNTLYQIGVNPIVNFKNTGFMLFGDKTLAGKPGAFDHIGVRRLFIVLETAISTMANYSLFEFNDSVTQANFRNAVNPYLKTIKSKRGVYAYQVICDDTNNTPDIVDSNQFVGSILIQPEKSINYITLNFVATNTGVQFSTVGGTF